MVFVHRVYVLYVVEVAIQHFYQKNVLFHTNSHPHFVTLHLTILCLLVHKLYIYLVVIINNKVQFQLHQCLLFGLTLDQQQFLIHDYYKQFELIKQLGILAFHYFDTINHVIHINTEQTIVNVDIDISTHILTDVAYFTYIVRLCILNLYIYFLFVEFGDQPITNQTTFDQSIVFVIRHERQPVMVINTVEYFDLYNSAFMHLILHILHYLATSDIIDHHVAFFES